MEHIGYGRVSTKAQNIDRQIDQLRQAGCTKIFTDVGTGSSMKLTGITDLKAYARDGDRVTVPTLDRVGRSMSGILKLIHELAQRNIVLDTLDGLTTDPNNPGGKILLAVTAAMAEVERDLIIDRTHAGLKAARARGRVGGRRPRLTPAQEKAIVTLVQSGQETAASAAQDFAVSRSTVYRILERASTV